MKDKILVHAINAYNPIALLISPHDFVFSSDPQVVKEWTGPLLICGGWDPQLTKYLRERPSHQRLVYQVIDAADTLPTLRSMDSIGRARDFATALIADDRDSIVRMFYEAIRPDVFVVHNSLMTKQFLRASTPALVVQWHSHANLQLRLNTYDRMLDAIKRPRAVQNGGLKKYIRADVQAYLEQLQQRGVIELLQPNIEGGWLGEATLIPPEPQIVISCRAPRVANVGSLQIDYTNIERDWKPATKYVNSIYSGSHFICTKEQSVCELSAGDELAILIDRVAELPAALDKALAYDPHTRALRALERKHVKLSTSLSPEHSASYFRSLFY